jgi:hypothetical protein
VLIWYILKTVRKGTTYKGGFKMVGVLKVNESEENFKKEKVTSTFYRLEKCIDKEYGYYDVYEFYSVKNGCMYIRHHEETRRNNEYSLGWIDKDTKLGKTKKGKEIGNKLYSDLKSKGYVFVGIYECDVCGYSKRIK